MSFISLEVFQRRLLNHLAVMLSENLSINSRPGLDNDDDDGDGDDDG